MLHSMLRSATTMMNANALCIMWKRLPSYLLIGCLECWREWLIPCACYYLRIVWQMLAMGVTRACCMWMKRIKMKLENMKGQHIERMKRKLMNLKGWNNNHHKISWGDKLLGLFMVCCQFKEWIMRVMEHSSIRSG